MSESVTVLFTCCGGSGGWSVTRSLESVDRYRLIGVDSDHLVAGMYAPGLDEAYVVPPGDSDKYISAILDIVLKEKVDVLWPCSDEEVISVGANRKLFEDAGAHVVAAPDDVLSWIGDKPRVVEKVSRAGVPVPRTVVLDENLDGLIYPVIVRPRTARSAKGVVFFDSYDQVAAYRDSLGELAGTQFVQEVVPYQVGNLYLSGVLLDAKQQVKALFGSRAIKATYDWGGPALGGVPVKNQRLNELALKIIDATGPWYGPVNIEYIFDSHRNDFVFIEVNARYWGYSYLATAAGVNFPDLTVRLALNEDFEPVLDYRMDVFTLTSREQVGYQLDQLNGALPGTPVD